MTTTYTDHATAITSKLINAIKHDGPGDWSAPWHHNGTAIWAPVNATTGSYYRGGNIPALAIEAMSRGFESREWATYRQWQTIGAQVRNRETGTRCLRWVSSKPPQDPKVDRTNQPTDEGDENAERAGRMVPKRFVVFNADQVDGYQPQHASSPPAIGEVEADIVATGASILHQGDQAFYMPRADVIQIPYRERFATAAGYYSTVLHELSHWTGHRSRLNRDYGKRFGGDGYANEELIAELSAAILTARFQFANEARPDHARYLGQWLAVLNEDPRHLFAVANQAQAAADYIRQTSPNETPPNKPMPTTRRPSS